MGELKDFPTSPWARTEARLLKEASGHETIWNAFRPQTNFRYPPAPRWDASIDIEHDFRRLVFSPSPESVRLGTDLLAVLSEVIERKGLAGKTILVPESTPWEFTAAAQAFGCRTRTLGRDPSDIRSEDFRDADAVFFSQPNRVDGFYYPDEMYHQLIVRAREANSQLVIVSEESASLFTLNIVAPGRCDPFKIPGSVVVKSLSPVMAPHGPELAWSVEAAPASTRTPSVIDAGVVLEAASLYSSFRTRQGAAFGEFQRKILLVQKGLRLLTDALKPVLVDGTLEVPIWPESSYYLLLSGRALRKRGADAVTQELARDFGLVLPPGGLYGQPEHLQLCFAATPKWLEGLGKRLSEAFLKVS